MCTHLPTSIKYIRNKKYLMHLKIPLQFLTAVLRWIFNRQNPKTTSAVNKALRIQLCLHCVHSKI